MKKDLLRYLALGDSYTIGEAVTQEESFPFQLVESLKSEIIIEPRVIAKTGWTTGELLEAIDAAQIEEKFDLVTLLIGVNNQYRGNSPEVYRNEFKTLLELAVQFAEGRRDQVFVISIPDWGVTPFAKKENRDTDVVAAEIDLFNAICKAETENKGVSYIEITFDSRLAEHDESLLAEDGLHPSAKMYAEWTKKLAPIIIARYSQ